MVKDLFVIFFPKTTGDKIVAVRSATSSRDICDSVPDLCRHTFDSQQRLDTVSEIACDRDLDFQVGSMPRCRASRAMAIAWFSPSINEFPYASISGESLSIPVRWSAGEIYLFGLSQLFLSTAPIVGKNDGITCPFFAWKIQPSQEVPVSPICQSVSVAQELIISFASESLRVRGSTAGFPIL